MYIELLKFVPLPRRRRMQFCNQYVPELWFMREVLSQNSRESMKILVSHVYPREPENRKPRRQHVMAAVRSIVSCDPETLRDVYDRKAESVWDLDWETRARGHDASMITAINRPPRRRVQCEITVRARPCRRTTAVDTKHLEEMELFTSYTKNIQIK